ncbi:ATP-binding protein [Chloroflexota bacterium]
MIPTKKKRLSMDVGVIASLGRDSIKDHTTAILELVKNSYDAGAKIVEVEIKTHVNTPYIRIADNGKGMTEYDIDNNWLRVGFSGKRQDKFIDKRRKTGEKGIGRLSADRLGEVLEMRSRTPSDGDISIIINWNKFDEMGKNVEDVEFDYFDRDVQIRIPKIASETREPKSGTELIIRNLRQEWTKADIDDLYKQLSMLISPFDNEVDFTVQLLTSEDNKYEQISVPEISKYFEVKLDGIFDPLKNLFKYDIWERVPGSSKRTKISTKPIVLDQMLSNSDLEINLTEQKIGPVRVVLFYYPQNKKTILGSKLKMRELKTYLESTAGIKLYRDSIRVKPYGEPNRPGGDWLNLGYRFAQNPAGRGRANHRIRPSQLVGAIFIGRDDNPELSDSASREGLIQYDSFRLLYEFARGCIRLVEARSHSIFTREEELFGEDEESVDKDLDTVNKKLGNIRDDLQEISKTLSTHDDKEVKAIGETVAVLVSKINYATESIELLESQTRLYRGLATIGIASAVFGHETQIQISRLVGAVNIAKEYLLLSPPEIPNSVSNIDTAIGASQKVMAWGGFALDRIRRDKRERNAEKISEIIARIINDLRSAFEAIDIDIDDKKIDESIESKVYQIDIESIILNLLTNAYTACRQVKQNRKIKVHLQKETFEKKKGFTIAVSDSGPGVNEKLRSIIWEPAFTTKTTKKGASEEGTGMGLAIIDGIVEEMNGYRNVGDDSELGGARFNIWLPIID